MFRNATGRCIKRLAAALQIWGITFSTLSGLIGPEDFIMFLTKAAVIGKAGLFICKALYTAQYTDFL